MITAIVDYGSGNLHSARKAFERALREADRLSEELVVTADPDLVRRADRLVLPGVGAFAECRRGLDAVPGLVAAMSEAAIARGSPFLGICVGMQLMATRGHEYAVTDGLGWIPGDVRLMVPGDATLKLPHMGWNTLSPCSGHPLFSNLATGPGGLHAYFVHSFQLETEDPAMVLAVADYGGPVTAAVAHGNLAGTQFHPEKSQRLGLGLIANFLAWRP